MCSVNLSLIISIINSKFFVPWNIINDQSLDKLFKKVSNTNGNALCFRGSIIIAVYNIFYLYIVMYIVVCIIVYIVIV